MKLEMVDDGGGGGGLVVCVQGGVEMMRRRGSSESRHDAELFPFSNAPLSQEPLFKQETKRAYDAGVSIERCVRRFVQWAGPAVRGLILPPAQSAVSHGAPTWRGNTVISPQDAYPTQRKRLGGVSLLASSCLRARSTLLPC